MHKLGFGSFSTAWLVRDLQYGQFHVDRPWAHRNTQQIALKRNSQGWCCRKIRGTWSRTTNLKASQGVERQQPSRAQICPSPSWFLLPRGAKRLTPLSSSMFWVQRYLPWPRLPTGRLPGAWLLAQVLLAVKYLHSSGIVHGGEPISTCECNCSFWPLEEDIHMANILFRLDTLSPENIASKFGRPSIGKLARRDGQPSGRGVRLNPSNSVPSLPMASAR